MKIHTAVFSVLHKMLSASGRSGAKPTPDQTSPPRSGASFSFDGTSFFDTANIGIGRDAGR